MEARPIRALIPLLMVFVGGIIIGYSISYGIARSSHVDNDCVAFLISTKQRIVATTDSGRTTSLSEDDWLKQLFATQRTEAHEDVQTLYSCMAHEPGAMSASDVNDLLLIKTPLSNVVRQFGSPNPSWKLNYLNLFLWL